MRAFVVVVLASSIVGCGGAPPPTSRLASSEAAIRAAREMGAEADPQAKLHLKFAAEQRAQAEELVKNGDNKKAEILLRRSEADAELALALAKEGSAKAAAQKSLDEVRELKKRVAP